MLEKEDRPLTFLRFGIQRKKEFLRDVRETYDGLVLQGNILLYQYRSTPTAIFMCERPFFVDPMSYLFGQPYEDFKQRVKKGPGFKPSFEKLMSAHGLNPADFFSYEYTELLHFLSRSQQNISIFTNNSLNFQWNNVWQTIEEAKELMKREKGQNLQEHDYRPRFLVPPYFLYAQGNRGKRAITTELNVRILDYCWNEREKWGDLFPMVFVRKEHLANDFLDEIISIMKSHEFPGYCIWVEDFDERLATRSQVRGLIKLTRELAKGDCQIVMLYGGYFSMLLYYFGMTCVCHGLAYGEARSVTAAAQQGTGPAPIRYYVLELHRFLTLPDALRILRERPDLICSCNVCQRVMRGDPDRVTLYEGEDALAEMHFLWNRYQERLNIAEAGSMNNLIQDLEFTLTLNEDIDGITKPHRVYGGYEERPIVDPSYIREWKAALEEATSS